MQDSFCETGSWGLRDAKMDGYPRICGSFWDATGAGAATRGLEEDTERREIPGRSLASLNGALEKGHEVQNKLGHGLPLSTVS
ncbi:hypothetical protein D7322_25230 [Sphingobacterium puteale]|uniref:Uncharacterized protein n=1 Tax=Sphingobacterium puteale TaxID=2420510 RepID=A0A420VRD6_9SPHI|nr:hypothetical protein [Sphingobacterium puteale]RKO68911.1 hypothetical protein D7322_25230 [Sphingobacterium puteale]